MTLCPVGWLGERVTKKKREERPCVVFLLLGKFIMRGNNRRGGGLHQSSSAMALGAHSHTTHSRGTFSSSMGAPHRRNSVFSLPSSSSSSTTSIGEVVYFFFPVSTHTDIIPHKTAHGSTLPFFSSLLNHVYRNIVCKRHRGGLDTQKHTQETTTPRCCGGFKTFNPPFV